MNEIASSLVKLASSWFLYIFIVPDANLGTSIMNKRSNQVAWLKLISNFPGITLTYAQLAEVIQTEITAKMGKSPAAVLADLYLTHGGQVQVAGIGTESDANKTTSKLWTYVANALDVVIQIVNTFFGSKKTDEIQPKSSDWPEPGTEGKSNFLSAGLGLLPYIAIGGIFLYMYNLPNNKGKT